MPPSLVVALPCSRRAKFGRAEIKGRHAVVAVRDLPLRVLVLPRRERGNHLIVLGHPFEWLEHNPRLSESCCMAIRQSPPIPPDKALDPCGTQGAIRARA